MNQVKQWERDILKELINDSLKMISLLADNNNLSNKDIALDKNISTIDKQLIFFGRKNKDIKKKAIEENIKMSKT